MPGKSYTPPDLLAAIASENWPRALALAVRFRSLGEGERAIRQAHAAQARPDFYREIGHDPAALLQHGIAALRARFSGPGAIIFSRRAQDFIAGARK